MKYYPSIKVVLYDNSLLPINEQYSENVIYFHDKINGGVSAGYNYASKIAKELGNIDFLLLLDQDTLFSSDYIDVLVRKSCFSMNLRKFNHNCRVIHFFYKIYNIF